MANMMLVMILLVILYGPVYGQETTIRSSGGSVQIKANAIEGKDGSWTSRYVNAGSTLTREWVVVNDPSLPAWIVDPTGLSVEYLGSFRAGFGYSAEYKIQTKEALTAYQIVFLTFNVWGDLVENLSASEVTDIPANQTRRGKGAWKVLSETEASESLACIAYISQVRTKDGRVLRANRTAVLNEARRLSEGITESDLQPEQD